MKHRTPFTLFFILFITVSIPILATTVPAATLTLTAPPSVTSGEKFTAQIGFGDSGGVKAFCLVLTFSSGSTLSTNLSGFKRNTAFIPVSSIGGEAVNFEYDTSVGKIYIIGLSPVSASGKIAVGSIMFNTAANAVINDTQVVTLSGQIYSDTGIVQELVPVSQLFTVNAFTDSDHDGMDDNWERYYFGDLSHDGNADSDHDGVSDKDEYINGTDPVVDNSSSVALGDINGDGVVDLQDAMLVLQVLSGKTPSVTIRSKADVNQDGKLGAAETIYILQKVSGLRK